MWVPYRLGVTAQNTINWPWANADHHWFGDVIENPLSTADRFAGESVMVWRYAPQRSRQVLIIKAFFVFHDAALQCNGSSQMVIIHVNRHIALSEDTHNGPHVVRLPKHH